MVVNIYINTSIRGPRRRAGKYMYILMVETSKGPADLGKMESSESTTENQANLLALEAALKRLKTQTDLTIWTECSYVAAALRNRWFEEWSKNDWKTVRGTPVADSEIWRSIQEMLGPVVPEIKYKENHEYKNWMERKLREEKRGEK